MSRHFQWKWRLFRFSGQRFLSVAHTRAAGGATGGGCGAGEQNNPAQGSAGEGAERREHNAYEGTGNPGRGGGCAGGAVRLRRADVCAAGGIGGGDYATGLAKAYSAGELSSRVGIRGILKKLGYLVIVAVAGMLDWLIRYGAAALGWEWAPEFLVSSVVIVWLIINELLSILENVEAIGVPVPAFLRKLLGRLQVSTEAKADTEEA